MTPSRDREGRVDRDIEELAQRRDRLLRPLAFRPIAVVFLLGLGDQTRRQQKLRLGDPRSLKLAAQRCEEPGERAAIPARSGFLFRHFR